GPCTAEHGRCSLCWLAGVMNVRAMIERMKSAGSAGTPTNAAEHRGADLLGHAEVVSGERPDDGLVAREGRHHLLARSVGGVLAGIDPDLVAVGDQAEIEVDEIDLRLVLGTSEVPRDLVGDLDREALPGRRGLRQARI